MNSDVLKALSKDDLVALILAQQVQIAAQAVQIGALTARIAELEARLDAPRKLIINETLWKCAESRCTSVAENSRPANSCIRLVKKIGPVTSFATPRGELSADELQRCNAAA